MNALDAKEFYARVFAIQTLLAKEEPLRIAVQEGVDGFFQRYPALQRTTWAEQIAVVVTFERLTAAPQTQPERKIA